MPNQRSNTHHCFFEVTADRWGETGLNKVMEQPLSVPDAGSHKWGVGSGCGFGHVARYVLQMVVWIFPLDDRGSEGSYEYLDAP